MGGDEPGAVGFLAGLSAGSRIAGYRLEEQIGEGGMAVVFRARDERLQRQVALKILSPALVEDEEFRRRFVRESQSAAAVDDPHIIPIFEAGDANGVLFIAMRYVPGGDVGTLVRRLGPLPGARAAAVVSAVASALDAAHAAGLVHRDVKPANMLVDTRPGRPDHVYLSDFGLTKGSLSSTSLTSTGHFIGTLDYCAPEQIRGQKVDPRTDEYALACVAFALLSGRPPFHRDGAMAVMYAQLSELPPMLGSLRPDLPPEVDEVMRRALAKATEDRYPSCGEFADALRIALGLRRYNSDPPVLDQPSLADQAALPGTHTSMIANPDSRGSDEAIKQYHRTLVHQRHALGPDHPDTLATRFSIAQEMAACGDHAGAEEEFRAVFAGRQRKLGPCHPETLIARFSMAQQMAARGNHAGAEEEFRAVFVARQRHLGPDHRDTLIARFSEAQQMAERGNHAGAEEEFRGVLSGLRRTLGADHPDTLATWFSIAQQLAARGDDAGAEKEFRYMLPHLRRKLGPDHPVTLIAWFGIAQQLAARGDDAGAEKEFRHMLPHLRRKLGPDHPHTLAAIEWLDYIQAKKNDRSSTTQPRRKVSSGGSPRSSRPGYPG
jgi:serine/threonine protein kinase